MTSETYAMAVQNFEALLAQPRSGRHKTPATLIRAAGLPPSSGYRHVATLEAEGLLRRDRNGAYLPGLTAVRTGLRAFGLGAIAPVAEPVITQLRQATRHTVFIGICDDANLVTGPYSIGSETRHHPVQPRYLLEELPDLVHGRPSETSLRYVDSGMVRRVNGVLAPLPLGGERTIVLGLFLSGHGSDAAALSAPLLEASRQFETLTGSPP